MSQSANAAELFQSAQDTGEISPATLQVLQVTDIGQQIQGALGSPADEFESSEAMLVSMMPDDSGSIRFKGNTQVVCDGHNQVLDSLSGTKQKEGILIHTRYLNGEVLFPFCSLDAAIRMGSNNYNPIHGTPLYDQTVALLATVLAKSQEFTDNGIAVRTVTLIITDGAEAHSTKYDIGDVTKVVRDMLASENHIIAAMGIDDGETDFRQVFQEMGIPDDWILTPQNTEHDIRAAFNTFSQSAVRASQGAASFSQTAVAGFGN
jgi:hypothetical protein